MLTVILWTLKNVLNVMMDFTSPPKINVEDVKKDVQSVIQMESVHGQEKDGFFILMEAI